MPIIPAALKRLIEAFERLGIRYAAGGSVASSVHGSVRATKDIDLIADIRPEHAEPLAAELGGDFYVDPAMIRDALRAGRPFNIIHIRGVFKFDVFPAKDAFTRMQIERRERAPLDLGSESLQLAVLSPEDTILAKLDWYRQGGCISEQQWRDVLGVLRIRGERLDRAHMREWADRLGVADLLTEAFRQSGIAGLP